MAISTTSKVSFLRSVLPSTINSLIPRIYFRLKTFDIDNQYDIYSRTCADGLSILEGVDFTVSYTHVSNIRSLHIIIAIASEEGLVLYLLDIPNAFQNIIFPHPA